MTMAHSLELRFPFLDREVMAAAARLAREEQTCCWNHGGCPVPR